MDKITINVTQDDIDKGVPQNTGYCPIALSLKREFPKSEIISVGLSKADVYIPKKKFLRLFPRPAETVRINLPAKASKFIINYDAYGPKDEYVKPFTFEAFMRKVKG